MADDDDNYNTQYNFNNNIMRAAIISLSAVVLLVLLLHIYARWLLRRQAQRREAEATVYRLGLAALAHAHSSTELPPKAGLDPAVIALLPTFIFKKTNQDTKTAATTTAAAAESECPVCLSVLEEGEMVRVLPNCDHLFHVECIDKWLSSNSTCPLCRAEVEPQPPLSPPEPNEGSNLPSAPTLEGSSRAPSKISWSDSRLSSFRRMLSRERSSRRIQPEEDLTQDLERQ